MVFRDNRNVIILVTGEPGSGKSYVSLKLGELLDPRFFKNPFEGEIKNVQEAEEHLAKRIKFRPEDFTELLAKGSQKLYKGAVVIMEEVGVQISADEFQTFMVRAINKIFQLFRFMHIIVIMTVPQLDYVAKKSRSRIQYHVQAFKWRYMPNGKTANITKTHRVVWNERQDKFYRYRLIEGGNYLQPYYFTKAVSELMIKGYESLARSYKKEYIQEIDADVSLQKKRARQKRLGVKSSKLTTEELMTLILNDKRIQPYKVGNQWYVSHDSIKYNYGLTTEQTKMIRVKVQQKIREEMSKKKKTDSKKKRDDLEGAL